jgi:hypothetical protein
MKDALDSGRRTVVAGPDAPRSATCPACRREVTLRCRRNGRETLTWFYRHRRGAAPDCPRRSGLEVYQ